MNWQEIEINLREDIRINEHLDFASKYKIVIEVPPYVCKKYSGEGFKVKIGHSNFINISLDMLKNTYFETIRNNGIYNNNVFGRLYPNELMHKPCYVHALGKLFVIAGAMETLSKREYKIL